MNTILSAVDFTDAVQHVTGYATILAKAWHTNLHIINIPQYPMAIGDNPMPLSIMKDAQDDAVKNLNALQQRLFTTYNYTDITVSLEDGGIAAAIDTKAHDLNASLIVLGGVGIGSAEDSAFTWDSITTGVIHHTTLPVLCVPATAAMNLPVRIVFATDFNTDDILCFEHLLSIAGANNCYIEVVHVNHGDKEAVDTFKRRIEDMSAVAKITFQELEGTAIENTLMGYAAKQPHTWLAVNRRYHTVFTRLFDRSVSSHLLQQATVPVLVYNAHKR